MELPSNFKKSYCDQIVGNRNKEFGQYELRVTYVNRMYKAQLWVFFVACGIIGLLEWFSKPVEAVQTLNPTGPVVFREIPIDVFEMPKAKPAQKTPASSASIPAAKADPTKLSLAKPLEITKDETNAKIDSSLMKPIVEGKVDGEEGLDGLGLTGIPKGQPTPGDGDGEGKEPGVNGDEFGTNPIDVPEILPEFKGNLQGFFAKTTRYPDRAVEDGIEGQVFVLFIVDERGKVVKPEILKGIRGDCDQEALRVVKSMPDWAPGKMGGKPVKVWMRIPVKFKLSK